MKGDLIPTVDPGDFKKAWEVRQVCFGCGIDVQSIKPLFKPETNISAAISRASLLWFLTQTLPDQLSEFMDHGQPSDVFLAAIAQMRLVEGAAFDLEAVIEQARKLQL